MPRDDPRRHGGDAGGGDGSRAAARTVRHRRGGRGDVHPRDQAPSPRGASRVPSHPGRHVRREAARGEGPDDAAAATVAGRLCRGARKPARPDGPWAVRPRARNPPVPVAGGPVLRQERGGRAGGAAGGGGEAFPRARARVSRHDDWKRIGRVRTSEGRRGRGTLPRVRRLAAVGAHHVPRRAPEAANAASRRDGGHHPQGHRVHVHDDVARRGVGG
mmetsp:Transcript_14184/g.61760  ORF Transcript_14184/g.61760 Transcript_14184/m.61760 type:complete len:217 (+) Transcript_14184:522-1172(+)